MIINLGQELKPGLLRTGPLPIEACLVLECSNLEARITARGRSSIADKAAGKFPHVWYSKPCLLEKKTLSRKLFKDLKLPARPTLSLPSIQAKQEEFCIEAYLIFRAFYRFS